MNSQEAFPRPDRSRGGALRILRPLNRLFARLVWLFVGLWAVDHLSDLAYRSHAGSHVAIPSSPGRYSHSVQRSPQEADSVLGVIAGQSSPTPDRLRGHRDASQQLLDLALFYDGRGMHSIPAASLPYDSIVFDPGWKGNQMRGWFTRKTGMIFSDSRRPVGFFDRPWNDQSVPVQGCAVCHVGKALGVVIPGLGNKNIDPAILAHSALNVQGAAQWLASFGGPQEDSDRLAEQSAAFCQRTADERLANQTQGMVSVTTIRSWFYQQAGRPVPADATPGAVKAPALWGFKEKLASGLFCDGMGEGPAWLAAVELVAGQTPEAVRSYVATLTEVEDLFGRLLPPAYPLPIDLARASRGRNVFNRHCQSCHGTYVKDADRLPIFAAPKFVEMDEVQTDPDRLLGNTPEFLALVDANPLADLMRIKPGYRHGYLAPRLEGVWARFPYMHNGSVPNIAALLSPAGDRPRVFSLDDAGEARRFDVDRLGLTVPTSGSDEEFSLLSRGLGGARDVYLVSRVGHSNQGHEFGVTLDSEAKRDLIEYLKTP